MSALSPNKAPLLQVENLRTEFQTPGGKVQAVRGVTFEVARGETVGIVGESGSGKSVTSLSIMGLIPSPPGKITGGSVKLDGVELVGKPAREMQKLRGSRMAMVFQDPFSCLNPTMTLGTQVAEPIRLHQGASKAEARDRVLQLFRDMRIPNPELRLRQYPHEISGGQRQRVMIAMAFACNPELLIADEPTTALDVTVQAQVLALMAGMQKQTDAGIVLITHDLGVVAEVCDRVLVMYAGMLVESGTVEQIFRAPKHPYTQGLLASLPQFQSADTRRLSTIAGQPPDLAHLPPGCPFTPVAQNACPSVPRENRNTRNRNRAKPRAVICMEANVSNVVSEPLLTVQGLVKHFHIHQRQGWRMATKTVRAVDGIDLTVAPGETVGLVGESGCGKSTAGRAILRLLQPTSGQVTLEGENVLALQGEGLRQIRQRMNIVFQDPYAALDPRMMIGDIIAEPLRAHRMVASRAEGLERARELLQSVGTAPRIRHTLRARVFGRAAATHRHRPRPCYQPQTADTG